MNQSVISASPAPLRQRTRTSRTVSSPTKIQTCWVSQPPWAPEKFSSPSVRTVVLTGPPRCSPIAVLSFWAQIPHLAYIVAKDRGTVSPRCSRRRGTWLVPIPRRAQIGIKGIRMMAVSPLVTASAYRLAPRVMRSGEPTGGQPTCYLSAGTNRQSRRNPIRDETCRGVQGGSLHGLFPSWTEDDYSQRAGHPRLKRRQRAPCPKPRPRMCNRAQASQ